MLTALKTALAPRRAFRLARLLPRSGQLSLREAWATWRHERDLRAIERALGSLSARQLGMIGMSHGTIRSDVSGLIDRTETARAVADDVLRLVDHRPPQRPLLAHAA